MGNGKFAVRLALRSRRFKDLDRDARRRVLSDDDMLGMVEAEAMVMASTGLDATQADLASPMDFFQWLIDNSDAIIAFIMKIIALFDGV